MGDFPRAVYRSKAVEACYRTSPQGPLAAHYHSQCTEIILLVQGEFTINGVKMQAGEIAVLEPGEVHDSHCDTACTFVTIKTPAGGDDKVYV